MAIMRKQTAIWKTKDGKKLRICDMTDSHLVNSIRFLTRAHERFKEDLSYPVFSGEMAQMYAEQEWESAIDSEPEYLFPIYDNLINEAERRNLSV